MCAGTQCSLFCRRDGVCFSPSAPKLSRHQGQSSVEVVRLQQDTQHEAKCSSFRSWSYPEESSLSCFLEGLLQMPRSRGAEPSSDRLCHCPSLVTLCPCLPLLLTSEPARTTHYRGAGSPWTSRAGTSGHSFCDVSELLWNHRLCVQPPFWPRFPSLAGGDPGTHNRGCCVGSIG